ncbi:MAG TPA: phasin family protein [Roseiarcus sp.]|nr:phasin family protein [Roseiarcus sp.]
MARENETPADLSAAATKAGARVTKEATAQAEQVGDAATGAFEASGRTASGAFEASGRTASGVIEASVKGAQDYQTKLVQIFQANAQANLQLAQKLIQIRSPTDFIETMSAHMRERAALMTEQAKELASLGQEATRSAVDALVHPKG